MGTPRTGTLEPEWTDRDGRRRYTAKIRLADGTRHREHVPLAKCVSKDKAKDWAQWLQEQEDANGAILKAKVAKRAATDLPAKPTDPAGETCDEWFTRFLAHRKDLGLSSFGDDKYRWKLWISPLLGPKPIAKVTRDDVEDVRDALDRAVLAYKREGKGRGRLAPKTAMNVWSVLTKSLNEACSSKRRDLRARTDNPCSGVQPPETGDSKRKTFIYPVEFLALAACDDVPLVWREVHAVACYTYLRPGELKALRWSDVDLKQGILSVTKAWDGRSKKVKEPKTRNGVRDVPIPLALLPLLKRMREASTLEALVVPHLSSVNEDTFADVLRSHLKLAKVTRARLSEDTATTMGVNFRSWRDSGITWLGLDGVDVAKMQRRAGHDDIKTTLGYVKMAEDIFGIVGAPFPPLPTSLVEGERSKERSSEGGINLHPSVITIEKSCEGRELKTTRKTRFLPMNQPKKRRFRQIASAKRLPRATRSDRPRQATRNPRPTRSWSGVSWTP